MVVPDEMCPALDLHSVFTTTGHSVYMGRHGPDFYQCTPAGPASRLPHARAGGGEPCEDVVGSAVISDDFANGL